jgi:SAM-dependent methyltransferase
VTVINRARARLALRQRFRDPSAAKNEAQLRWWLERWLPVVRSGGFNPGDTLELLAGEKAAPDYLGRRWQQARAEVGVDPLAEEFARHELLLPDSPAVYLTAGGEAIPLLSGTVDVVLARNSLDFVDDPDQVLREAQRILAPGGTLIVLFDVDSSPSPSEPHELTTERVRSTLSDLAVVRGHSWPEPFGHDGHRVVLVARRGD